MTELLTATCDDLTITTLAEHGGYGRWFTPAQWRTIAEIPGYLDQVFDVVIREDRAKAIEACLQRYLNSYRDDPIRTTAHLPKEEPIAGAPEREIHIDACSEFPDGIRRYRLVLA